MHSVNGHRRNNNFREEPAKSSVQVQSVRASSQRLAFLVTSVSPPPHDSQASSAHYSVQQIQRAGTLLVKHLPKAGRGASSTGARRFCLRSPVPALDDSKTALNIHPDRPGLSPASPVTRAHAHPNKQLPLRPLPSRMKDLTLACQGAHCFCPESSDNGGFSSFASQPHSPLIFKPNLSKIKKRVALCCITVGWS